MFSFKYYMKLHNKSLSIFICIAYKKGRGQQNCALFLFMISIPDLVKNSLLCVG
jgi:hypothetical protein